MLTKNKIKYIQSLFQKKQRDEEKLFIAEGPKLAKELLNSNFQLEHIYATATWFETNTQVKVPATEISDTELSRISNLTNPNEVVVVVHQPAPKSEPVLQAQLIIVLDGIQDPGNMGTIIRTADWFGIGQIVCSNDSVEIYNPKVVQATMGSIARVNCWYKDLASWNIDRSIPVYGALLEGKNIYSCKKAKEGLLVIGNEGKGIREAFISKITHPVTIPGRGGAESLNAAVATGIIAGCLLNGKE